MYGTAKQKDNTTRVFGIAAVGITGGVVALGLAFGVGTRMIAKMTETEVVIIEQEQIEEEEPPPPPPVDVELPPPPPQVVLPEFTFDVPPPPNAIRQVEQVAQPVVRPPPKPTPPAPTITQRPTVSRRYQKPPYPNASKRAKEEGPVTIEMCVDENGRTSQEKIATSSGFPRLDEATLKDVQRQRFQAAENSNGDKVAMCGYRFTLVWELE